MSKLERVAEKKEQGRSGRKAGKSKRRGRGGGRQLHAIRPLVAGVDLASEQHWVCGPARADGEPNVRVFGATTPQLNALVDWLESEHVESVAMESTSVYWIPLYELLESRGIEAVLVNARQLHYVPGRKTDMNDCQWIQLLHSCGLLKGSFRPTETICKLRALLRQRGNLTSERTKAVQWMQKALDQMNVLVHRAVTDITGKTGMAIIRAIVGGERNPMQLAALRDRRCRKSREEIAEHLTGTWREEHLFNLERALDLYDFLEDQLARYEQRLTTEMEALSPPERATSTPPPHPNPTKERDIRRRGEQPLRTALWRMSGVDLPRIDAIGVGSAQTILSEVGLDLTAFPNEKHFVSWVRLCPQTPISGGKPLRKKNRGTGASRVGGVLRMAALTLARSKTALGAEYRRISRRRGATVAIRAMARKLAVLVFRMLRYGTEYVDVGVQAYEERHQARRRATLGRLAEDLGFDLVPRAAGPKTEVA